ncbi:MAG: TetR/AcrR family transcriptional regulator [Pseudomonadales bacterium]
MAKAGRRSNQERREHSTEQVLSSALALFVSKGFGTTSIDDIARQAELTKGAVYFYFEGKQALLLELLGQSNELYAGIFSDMRKSNSSASDQLNMFVDWCAAIGADNKELLLLPILISLEFFGREDAVEDYVKTMYDRYHNEMERVNSDGQRSGEFNKEMSPREQAAVLVALTDGMLLEWYRWGDRLDGRSLAKSARAVIMRGVLAAT